MRRPTPLSCAGPLVLQHPSHPRGQDPRRPRCDGSGIRAHPCEGNVRELEYAIERAATLAASDTLNPRDLGLVAAPAQPAPPASPEDESPESDVRRFVLEHHATMSDQRLAVRLGISRKTLWARRQQYGILTRKTIDVQRPRRTC